MRKNIIKISALALLGAFTLTSCSDDVIAKPAGYGDDNSPVVTIEGNSNKIYNNNFTDIYDAIRDGSLPQDVLNTLLYQYAVSIFGNYNAVTAARISEEKNPFGEVTLKAAVNSYKNGDKSVADKFIKEHSAFWTKDKAGNRVDDQNKVVTEDAAPSESEYARLNQKWETIEKRIAEKMYSAISGGSYSDRNVFYEERYLRALANDIENNVRAIEPGTEMFSGILTSAVEDYDVFTATTENMKHEQDFILHRKNYQSNYKLDETETKDQDATYVEDKLIPDIYRQLLVEQYILDESYDTLGRTSARNIDVLSIAKNTNYNLGANDLMNTFVKDTIFDDARTADIDLDAFKVVSNAWVGAFMADADYATTPEYALFSKAVPTYEKNEGGYRYFQGTAYGDMIEELKKIDANPKLSENESTYTNSNAYPVSVGKEIKTRELKLKDYTSTGWYIKSVGVSSLPDTIKNQLFDINVANALSGDKCVEYAFENGSWVTNEEPGKTNLINVVGKVKGQYFLRNTSRIAGTDVENDILFENDGTYYVVLVKDAIKSKSLNKASLAELEGQALQDAAETLERYVNEIVQIVAGNDTYQTLSKKHWIKKMDLKHHDSKVYEFFKTTFPELFE